MFSKRDYCVIICVSCLFMGIFYGYKELIPSNINWLLWSGDDSAQHYIGWLFYANNAWQFPIGNFSSLSYPLSTSIMYMDSIPLMAVLAKLFCFPSAWQYFGFFQLICFVLQETLAVILLKKYLHNRLPLFLYAFLFLACPIFLWRVNKHVALSAHWIILLSMCSIVYFRESFNQVRNRVILWAAVGFFCASIHFYFAPMCGIILVASTCQTFAHLMHSSMPQTQQFKTAARLVIPDYIAFFSSLLLTVSLLGGFSNRVTLSKEAPEWEKSFNLVSFFNGQKWSRILPDIEEYTNGQSEGFAYLGLGVLLLVVFFLSMILLRRTSIYLRAPEVIAFAVMFVLSLIAATSPMVTFGKHLIFSLPLPASLEQLWYVFRCCGRIAWVSVYCLMLLPAVILGQFEKKRILTILLFCIAFLQLYDISEKAWDRGSHVREASEDANELTSPAWDILRSSLPIQTVVKANESVMDRYASLGYLCNKYHWNLTNYYFARTIDNSTYTQQALDDPKPDQLFLFGTNQIEIVNKIDSLFYYSFDNYILGYCKEVPELEQWKYTRPADYQKCSSYELVWNSGVLNGNQIDLSNAVQDIEGTPSVVLVGYSFNREDSSPWTSIYFTIDGLRIDAESVDREDVVEKTDDESLLASGFLGFIPCSSLNEDLPVILHLEDAVHSKSVLLELYTPHLS